MIRQRFVAYFSRHMYRDLTDTPRPTTRVFRADSQEEAEAQFYEWRDRVNETAGGTDGRKKFIGTFSRMEPAP